MEKAPRSIKNGSLPFMVSRISKLRVWPIWKELKRLTVSAVCEDASASVRTEEYCRGLASDLGRNCELDKEIWLFNFLDMPGLRTVAADEAALAHLVIISVHHAEILPEGVKGWIELWLKKRKDRNAVLLVLFDPVYRGISSSTVGYLREVAERGHVEFLVRLDDSPN